jgi:hypothetical protein
LGCCVGQLIQLNIYIHTFIFNTSWGAGCIVTTCHQQLRTKKKGIYTG